MTLVVGLKGAEGVVLASDSQMTYGEIRESQTKLFKMSCGVIWGSSGLNSATQDLYTALEDTDLPANPGREETKRVIREAMGHYLLWATQAVHTEFQRSSGAIGAAKSLGRFGFTRSAFLRFDTLPLETTKMVAYMVAEEVVRGSSYSVDLPIQVATVSNGDTHILPAKGSGHGPDEPTPP